VWGFGDSYWNLANQYYGDPKLWWILAWFNRSPTEAHNKIGEFILIPVPLEDLLSLFNHGVR